MTRVITLVMMLETDCACCVVEVALWSDGPTAES